MCSNPFLDLPVEVLRRLERRVTAEDHVGPARGEILALGRGTGLDHHRVALRRPRHVERPLHGEPLALVVDRVHLGGVSEQRRLGVEDQRVVLPAVPELRGHLEELVGAFVAFVAGGNCSSRLKLRASDSWKEVTTFQAARPAVRWSRLANDRATVNGCAYVVDTVAASPRCSVTAPMDASTCSGSRRIDPSAPLRNCVSVLDPKRSGTERMSAKNASRSARPRGCGRCSGSSPRTAIRGGPTPGSASHRDDRVLQ